MTYMKQMVEDIRDYIEEEGIEINEGNQYEVEEHLNDELWLVDSVTGNGSGSYFFNTEKSKEQVLDDGTQYIKDMVAEFDIDADTVAKRFLDGDWEYWDVSIRCYLLSQAIREVIDSILK